MSYVEKVALYEAAPPTLNGAPYVNSPEQFGWILSSSVGHTPEILKGSERLVQFDEFTAEVANASNQRATFMDTFSYGAYNGPLTIDLWNVTDDVLWIPYGQLVFGYAPATLFDWPTGDKLIAIRWSFPITNPTFTYVERIAVRAVGVELWKAR